jgi:hypothetical protein
MNTKTKKYVLIGGAVLIALYIFNKKSFKKTPISTIVPKTEKEIEDDEAKNEAEDIKAQAIKEKIQAEDYKIDK